MHVQQVIFAEPHRAVLESRELDTATLGPTEIVVRSLASLISQGTEGAAFQGLLTPGGKEQRYPGRPGYANVSEVVASGSEAPFAAGDRVFSMAPHVSHARIDTGRELCVPVPDGLAPRLAVFTRLAMVSMSTYRTSTARVGDKAAVVGLGLVGNLAAQIGQVAGMAVTGIDLIPWRCDLAQRCGISTVLLAPGDDALLPEHQLVIEATGSTGGALTGVKLVQRHGELSLVGSQWGVGTETVDTLRLLGEVFERYIHIRSGWEWQLPTLPTTFGPASLAHSATAILGWLAGGRLEVEPMLSHVVAPDAAGTVYEEMVANKDRYLGVVFDWEQQA
jgi:2-desacetyl-2-hydroxyethyl bacteriochlorophyllide A dehydrogenase